MTGQAAELIRLLRLKPHPEGGFYRETFRDAGKTKSGRAHSTLIYFLLTRGDRSRWHRIDAAEAWHWYDGAPLELSTCRGNPLRASSKVTTRILGPHIATGERPQIVVPLGHWQQACSQGAYTLVGCSVAPGFTFERFELARDVNSASAPEKGRAAHARSRAKRLVPDSRGSR